MIYFTFLLLFFITPLFFTSFNAELFEVPKMYFVYTATLIILIFHLKKHGPVFKLNFLSLPLSLFLVAVTISTFSSIDPHTSFYGYYSRLNGGLLSYICYFILYHLLLTNLTPKLEKQIINFSLYAGLLVSIYAILQHFGIDAKYWSQDVRARVFSTLGQPNWLAAYLCILLPLAIHQSKTQNIKYLLLATCYFLTLLFTKSKSGLIAASISLALYFTFTFFKTKNLKTLLLPIIFIFLSLTITNPVKDRLFPPATITQPSSAHNQLPVTSSADIRKIVWQGALDLWHQFPLFGTGNETFAYSYYWVRPPAHNLTSEWNFLYNKAHNEYLNFLATTGTFGFLTYVLLLLAILYSLRHSYYLIPIISILITNALGFSVVVTNLYLFLLPALATPPSKTLNLPRFTKLPLIFLSLFLLYKNITFYLADIAYARSQATDQATIQLDNLNFALRLRPQQPLYHNAIASVYARLNQPQPAISHLQQSINLAPARTEFYKQNAQTYLYLATADSQYFNLAIDSLAKALALAPTDVKIYYLLGQFLQIGHQTDQAIQAYQQAINLKPNYDHAHYALGEIYFSQNNTEEAKKHFQAAYDINPQNLTAKNYLDKIDSN